jgi:hypothetical protein
LAPLCIHLYVFISRSVCNKLKHQTVQLRVQSLVRENGLFSPRLGYSGLQCILGCIILSVNVCREFAGQDI